MFPVPALARLSNLVPTLLRGNAEWIDGMMKRYPTYKDSGVEWIGEIPEHWGVIKLKYSDKVIMGQSPNSDDYNDTNEGLPFLQGNADFKTLFPKPKVWCGTANKIAEKEDVLLSVRAPIGDVNIADQSYGIGRGLCAIRSEKSLAKLLFYLALSLNDELNSIGTGSTYTAVSIDDIANVFLPNIPPSEQQSIADYLDRKTRQIDALIEKKQKQIDLLKEQRTAVINRAVTKGLNPNVKMKDTGIEWLGKIPEHWEVKPLKHAVRINQNSLPEHTDGNYEIQYIDIGNVDEGGLLNPPKMMTFGISPSRARRVVRKGDTIVSTVRTYLKAIAYIDSEDENLIASTGFAVLTPTDQIQSKYLYYLVPNPQIIDAISSLSVGVSYPAINSSELGSIPIWFPNSIEEQRDILNSIEHKIDGLRDLIKKTEKEIELFREYRTTLISEVVTGKMDVRECSTANDSS